VRGHVVGDQRRRDLPLHEFPEGQAAALKIRARLAGVYVFDLAEVMGLADDADGGPETRGR